MSSHGSTTTTDTAPPGSQQNYLNEIFSQARNLYNGGQGGPQLYSGNWTAGFNPNEIAAQNALLSYANGLGGDLAGKGLAAVDTGLNAPNVSSNPEIAAQANAAVQPIFQQLTNTVLPGVRDSAVAAGAYGSSRQGVAEGNAIGQAAQAATNASANIYANAYNKGLDTYTSTLSQLPTMYQLGAAPALTQSTVGGEQRAMTQAEIDQQKQTYEYQQLLPYLMLQQYLSYVGGNYGGKGTTDTSSPPSLFERWFGSSLI